MSRIEAFYPLSPMQQGLLVETLRARGSSAYVPQLAPRLDGELSVDAFREAWRLAFARHTILRTSFLWDDLRQPVQVVHREVALPLEEQDWSHLGREEQAARLAALLETERRRGFDLATPPLTRLWLLRLDSHSFRLVWTFHHLLLDGWSEAVLLSEVFRAYDALRRGDLPSLEAPRSFGDYIAWLQERPSNAESYWRAALEGFTEPTFPAPDRRPALSTPGSADDLVELTAVLPSHTTDALAAFARRHRLTSNTLIQGAWALLLGRYTGRDDVVFGTTLSTRPPELEGAESMVGLFINTLPVRVKLPAGAAVAVWLEQLQREQLEMRQHQDTPLMEIQSWSGVPRGAPLFETLVVFESYPVDGTVAADLERSGMTLADVRTHESSGYPLALIVTPRPRMTFRVQHDRRVVDDEGARRLLGHFECALHQLVSGAESTLAEIGLATPAERQQVLFEWNDTAREYPRGRCVHELFAEQARARPDAPALCWAGGDLTYAALDARANQLALRLRELGIQPDEAVGVAVETSPEMVVALLAVLKAGGAYVPLDLTSPGERLALVMQETRMAVVVTQTRHVAALPARGCRLLCLDDPAEGVGARPVPDPPDLTRPEHLACVITTSGSTGRPKAVAVPHRAIVRLVRNTDYARLGPEETFLQLAPLSFDASTFEIWAPLLNGGRLVLPPAPRLSIHELARTIREHGVTTLWLTAGLFHEAVDADPGCLRPLRQLLAGGDVLSAAHVRRFLREVPTCRMVNGYGPTESTTFACCQAIDREDAAGVSVPIGRPIANTRAYVLGPRLQPCPVGVPGELYLAGDGLARGYLHRPDLTAEAFVPDPFASRPGERLYRTGDLARLLPGGRLLFLGRNDAQVKVRGFRIEPAEVESTLRAHPAVTDCVVVARHDPPGEKRLVAYIVTGAETSDAREREGRELQAVLERTLPAHMRPSAILHVERLPLTREGKVDRAALPPPTWTTRTIGDGLVLPLTPVQQLVAEAWGAVLARSPLGLHREDHFFELGGHSLLATQVVSRMRESAGVEIPLTTLFEAPTLQAFAAAIEERRRREPGPGEGPIVRSARHGALPVSFAQQRLWFLTQLEPGNPFYNNLVVARLRGRLDVAALRRALDRVVRRHEALRTRFVELDGRPAAFVTPPQPVPLAILDLEDLPPPRREREERRLIQEDVRRPFDLVRGPSLRWRLLRLGAEEHTALLGLHHIVSDGWSMGVLLAEMRALYRAEVSGTAGPLAELPVQYADFARWQQETLARGSLSGQLTYWKRRLAGLTPLALPLDRPRRPAPRHRGRHLTFTFAESLARSLRQFAGHQRATLFMVLLAAFKALLGHRAGQDDVAVGTVVANRTRVETEPLIGFFVNHLVLRTDLSGDPTFVEVVRRVRETCLDGYVNQEIPFDRVVQEVEPGRDPGRSPLVQVTFGLQNVPMQETEMPGLELDATVVDGDSARYDLTLWLEERADGLVGTWTYDADIFDTATIAFLHETFAALCASAVARPKTRLSLLMLETEAQVARRVSGTATTPGGPRRPEARGGRGRD